MNTFLFVKYVNSELFPGQNGLSKPTSCEAFQAFRLGRLAGGMKRDILMPFTNLHHEKPSNRIIVGRKAETKPRFTMSFWIPTPSTPTPRGVFETLGQELVVAVMTQPVWKVITGARLSICALKKSTHQVLEVIFRRWPIY